MVDYIDIDTTQFHTTPKAAREFQQKPEEHRDKNQENMEKLFRFFSQKKTGEKVSFSWPNYSVEAVLLLLNENDAEDAVRLKMSVSEQSTVAEYDLLLRREKDSESGWNAHSLKQLSEGNSTASQLPKINEVLAKMAERI